MALFHIVSRTEHTTTPLKKRRRLLDPRWAMAIRVVVSINLTALLFVAVLLLSHNDFTFILLPTFLSMLTVGSKRYSFSIFLNSTPLYVVFSFCLSLAYYSFITVLVLLTHLANDIDHIILVAAALAWTAILDPLHVYARDLIEQRFNVRNRRIRQAIEAFTASLREEIDLVQVCDHLLTVIQQTMRPYSLALWMRTPLQEAGQIHDENEEIFQVDDADPFVLALLKHPGALDITRIKLSSPVLQELLDRSMEIVLPLASRGELIGLLALGPRLADEKYRRVTRVILSILFSLSLLRLLLLSILGPRMDDDRYTNRDLALLSELAIQVAPALRVAQMVQDLQQEVRVRERIEQELHTARSIQRAFLPKEVPELAGWQLLPYYQPAREVGGDFYDVIALDEGHLALIIGDVTGKGVPAALVMATVLTMLRSAARYSSSPAEILEQVNDLLVGEIPEGVFVTCFYVLFQPLNGRLRYANAGHEAPYRRQSGHASELWATGMPLGMLPGSRYEEFETTLAPGESLLLYSDGLVEAHNPSGEMFGFPRLQTLLSGSPLEPPLIEFLLAQLSGFTGDTWEQEDDVTLLLLQRTHGIGHLTDSI